MAGLASLKMKHCRHPVLHSAVRPVRIQFSMPTLAFSARLVEANKPPGVSLPLFPRLIRLTRSMMSSARPRWVMRQSRLSSTFKRLMGIVRSCFSNNAFGATNHPAFECLFQHGVVLLAQVLGRFGMAEMILLAGKPDLACSKTQM